MKWLDRLEEWLIASLMGAATLIVFVAVVIRYLSGLPIPGVQEAIIGINISWTQELCIYLFVWMAKFGAAYGVRTGIHVGVDLLVNRLSGKWRRACVIFGLLAGALFTGTVGTLGAGLVWSIAHTDQTSSDLELPMWIVYLAIPLGSYLMCLRFLQAAAQFARTDALPKHDHGFVEGLEVQLDARQDGPASGPASGPAGRARA